MYRPENAGPTSPRATGTPARSLGLPSTTASSSAKPELTEAARDAATASVSAWVRYGMSVTVSREEPPNALLTTDGLIPGVTVRLSTDGCRVTSGDLVLTSQPRTSTFPAPSAPVRTARRARRLREY